MKPESEITGRLRESFISLEGRLPESVCPPPELLWKAVRGGLTAEETGQLVDHTIVCAGCAEAWRLARKLSEEEEPGESTGPNTQAGKAGRFLGQIKIPLAAAAAILLLLVVPRLLQQEPDELLRGPEQSLFSLVSEDEALPRDQVLLRWTAGPPGASYHLIVTTEELDLLLERRNLEAAQLLVPAATLSEVPPGGRIYWRVEVTAPDGTRMESPTFVTQVE